MSSGETVQRTRFEGSSPILKVGDMAASVRYYFGVLGFHNADWGTDDFTCLPRDCAAIYLCRGAKGSPGPGSGSAWNTSLLFTKSTRPAVPGFATAPGVIRDPSR